MIAQSKYLKRFQQLTEELGESSQLQGNYLLIEKIPKGEQVSKGGIVMPSDEVSSRQISGRAPERSLLFVRVVHVGVGYYETIPEDPYRGESALSAKEGAVYVTPKEVLIPLDTQPGDIVAVPFVTVKWFSQFGSMEDYEQDSIGLTTENDIQWNVGDEAAYNAVFGVLNGVNNS